MSDKNYTQVLIDGNIYTLGGAEDQEYMQKLAECRVPKKDGNGRNDESDEAIDSRIQAHFSAQEKRLEVQKDYYEKFKGVLTMRQVEQIYERPAFNARMMRPQGAPRQMAPHRR